MVETVIWMWEWQKYCCRSLLFFFYYYSVVCIFFDVSGVAFKADVSIPSGVYISFGTNLMIVDKVLPHSIFCVCLLKSKRMLSRLCNK